MKKEKTIKVRTGTINLNPNIPLNEPIETFEDIEMPISKYIKWVAEEARRKLKE